MLKLSAPRKRLFGFILLGWALLLISDRIGELRQYQGAFVAMYTLAIASIILLTGYSGQLSLGHSALMAVGAYAGALSVNNFKLHPVIALIMAALVAGIFGLLLGYAAARLSGPYLAGTTLALAVSLPTIANQFPVLGGEQGLAFDIGTAPTRLGEDFSQYQWFFWISCLSALIMIWFLVNLLNSRYGREFRALRDNPTAAQLAGINIGRQKALAFSLS
ncbi:MAG: branched-chain amino acid ABC transporter permease, partial [Actinobacteria bacterium]|nr:branched-chain amino acid ABC transporter permease [Actinomycetota bacterium]